MPAASAAPEPGAFSVTDVTSATDFGFLRVERLMIRSPHGSAFERVVVRHPGAVAVVGVVGGAFVMIRQYRAAFDGPVLEIPAGKLDVDGEQADVAAIRELEEETGHTAGRVEELLTMYTGPGFTDEMITIYRAHDLKPVPPRPVGAEEELAEVVFVPIEEAAAMIARGDIRDAKSIVGIQAVLLGS